MFYDAKQKIGHACALALFESYKAEAPVLQKIHQELKKCAEILQKVPALGDYLRNPLLSKDEKKIILRDALKIKQIGEFLDLLVEKNLVSYFSQFVNSFETLFKNFSKIKTIYVKVDPLDEDTKHMLTKFLKSYFKGYETEIIFESCKDLHGGFIVRSDNLYWDNSLKGKISSLKIKMGI